MASQSLLHGPSQGRALAIMLPPLTLISHLLILLITILYAPSVVSSSATLWFSLYNVIAIGGSIAGLIGTLWANSTLISIYTTTYSTTLLILTLTLCTILIPTNGAFPNPLLSLQWFGERSFCKKLDGFRGNEQQAPGFGVRLMLLEIGAGCSACAMLAAQWWAIWGVWVWGRALKGNESGDRSIGGKGQRLMDIEFGNGDEKEKVRRGFNVMKYSKGVYD